jgi:nitroreductase
MEVMEAINLRASLKTHLSHREIEPEKITKILEAARVAPSARNFQPWRFVVVNNKKLLETLVKSAFSDVNHVAGNAPIIIFVCGNPGDDVTIAGKEYYLFDLGLAVENMVLTAASLGLVTHIMAGFSEEEAKKQLGIPTEVRCVAAIPLAYPDAGSYAEAAQERLKQRTRKSLKEMVFANAWANNFKI